MAHQAHNVPWITLASHLKFIREARHVTPHRTDLFPLEKPNQANDLNYFTKRLATTIRDFAKTERAKYPEKFDIRDEGQVISDELIERKKTWMDPNKVGNIAEWPERFLSLRDFQRIEQWIRGIRCFGMFYGSDRMELAEAFSILIQENELASLLRLAQHPEIPIESLHTGDNYHYGFSLLARDALQSYIVFNVLFCKPEIWEGGKEDYKDMECYKTAVDEVVRGHGGDAAKYPHLEFFGSPHEYVSYNSHPELPKYIQRGDFMVDLDRLRAYVKTCFVLMIRYEVVLRECGIHFNWEEEIRCALSTPWKGFRFKSKWTGDGQDWSFV